jgi:hypothetical protein
LFFWLHFFSFLDASSARVSRLASRLARDGQAPSSCVKAGGLDVERLSLEGG